MWFICCFSQKAGLHTTQVCPMWSYTQLYKYTVFKRARQICTKEQGTVILTVLCKVMYKYSLQKSRVSVYKRTLEICITEQGKYVQESRANMYKGAWHCNSDLTRTNDGGSVSQQPSPVSPCPLLLLLLQLSPAPVFKTNFGCDQKTTNRRCI